MLTNVITSPAFIGYELNALPSVWVHFWRRLGIPVLAWTVQTPEAEASAARFADNLFFDGYLPDACGRGHEPD
jgi:glycerophosphoryl diester phosphodiesterase